MYLIFANETTFAILGTHLWPLSVLCVQNVHKNTRFSLNKCGNSDSLFKMAESLYTMKDSFIFLIFLCVRIKINSLWQSFVA